MAENIPATTRANAPPAHRMMRRFFTAKRDWMIAMRLGNTTRTTPTERAMAKRPATPPTTSTASTAEINAVLTAIAKTHLGLETLESQGHDRLAVQGQASREIRAALRAAFAAGTRAARRRTTSAPAAAPTVIAGDIILTSPKPAAGCGGWAQGRVGAFRFCAKVYPAHADLPSFEIGRSRISKLELRRLDTGAVAYAWDRGLDLPATDAAAKAAVDLLARCLASHLYGPSAD